MHKLSRRHVIATLSGAAVTLCPAVMNAQVALEWGDIPTTEPIGQTSLLMADAGPVEVDVSTLQPGEVAVIARPNSDPAFSSTAFMDYVAVLRRTKDQMAYGADNDRPGLTQNAEYLVVSLVCPHRGKAVGITGDARTPFACTDRGGRHSSDFDAAAMGVAGASKGDPMIVPDYTISATDGTVMVSLA